MAKAADLALHAERVFDGDKLREDSSVLIADGKIIDVVKGAAAGAVRLPPGALLTAGFIDAQVNGGGGVMLNDDPSPQTIAVMTAAHRRFGTTSLLPTLISDTREKMHAAIAAVRDSMKTNPAVLGIHLEGPFLNVVRRGVHPEAHIIPAQADDVDLLASLKTGVILVTLAPEKLPDGFISALAKRGVIISAGHTEASAGEIEASLKQGVSGFTHLYNAMSQLQQRAPGAVGACLADDQSFASVIADGHHVSVEALRVALKAKTANKLFLVSDAMAALGTQQKNFKLFNEEIHVDGGRLATTKGTLAGALLDMASAVRFMIEKVGATLEEALTMASATPAAFLGVDKKLGRIAPGHRADLVALNGDMQAIQTWVAGVQA